ncbi:alcohol dehydrogenase catalytic domain-containing protein [Halarsenatibacter silvermanii]|uniref:L-iditol 2-dehydrogenase n=1 Tax=Halarsenatibacter silvermanii TaxID=321763 RepID=A0A1G9TL21_9FIRM|nr:alcohol dehydrogenase catalytic domain-containing protein [Halarsenatibacter silvermanii]SDM48340.1 L-iditol 2-dehydrogenase [Halarsenatibacter silvermanii]
MSAREAKMKAAVLKEPKDLRLEKIPRPECPPGGVLIETAASAICNADVKMVDKGHKALDYPRILGHEVTGKILESLTEQFERGDRVQIAPGIVCGECEFCQQGLTNNCEEIEILGFTRDGGFAEYLSIPAKGIKTGAVNSIPDKLSFSRAVFSEPLACCINGLDLARVKQGDSVLIIGAGPIGCLQAMLAETYGAKKIIMADRLERRLEFVDSEKAALTKVDCLINTGRESLNRAVMKETADRGVDVIILACRQGAAAYPLPELLKFRGRILLFSGLPAEDAALEVDGNLLHYGEKALIGAYGCTAEQNQKALKLIAEGKIAVDRLITDEIPLEQISQGIKKARNKIGMKTIIQFEHQKGEII